MKNSFIKKVAVLSAGAVVLSSMSFFGVSAQQETLLEGACTQGIAQIYAAHGYDFGSFNVSTVATGSYLSTQGTYLDDGDGKEHTAFNGQPQAIWESTEDEASSVQDYMFAVTDPCPEEQNGWELSLGLEDMVNTADSNIVLLADAIRVQFNGNLYILDGSAASANSEVTPITSQTVGGADRVYGVDTTSSIWGDTNSELLIVRSNSTNLRSGIFGITAEFDINVPHAQPAGTYTGNVVVTFTPNP